MIANTKSAVVLNILNFLSQTKIIKSIVPTPTCIANSHKIKKITHQQKIHSKTKVNLIWIHKLIYKMKGLITCEYGDVLFVDPMYSIDPGLSICK